MESKWNFQLFPYPKNDISLLDFQLKINTF